MKIPFVKPYLTGKEIEYMTQITSWAGDGDFTRRCHAWLEKQTGCVKALLTHSCTAALEMAALLIDIQPGDEVIMPSFTFVSTANAIVLRGGIPVFVDIRSDTLNLNENLIEAAITPKTKAIMPVHYAGVTCEMDSILKLAKKYNLYVIEDAAQGLLAYYQGRACGTLGQLGALSFHQTKNVISGEGGALLINEEKFSELAEIIREKGTDRSRFYRGEVDKYTWQHIGSSYLPSELIAAFLFAQLEAAEQITQRRLQIWNCYHQHFAELEKIGLLRRPIVPNSCEHNGHIYYILLNNLETRLHLAEQLKTAGIGSASHYVPLHLSPAGKKYSRVGSDLVNTIKLADCLLRLPLFPEMDEKMVERITHVIATALKDAKYGLPA